MFKQICQQKGKSEIMLRKALLTVTGVLAAVCTGLFVSQGVTNVHADNGDDAAASNVKKEV